MNPHFRLLTRFPSRCLAPSTRMNIAGPLRDFRRLLKDLHPRDKNHQIVFRGQTREYESEKLPSLIPAIRRPGIAHTPYRLKLPGFDKFVLDRMYAEAETQRLRLQQAEQLGLPEPHVDRTPWPHVYSSLVQHYCGGTNGMDVTFDAETALWFACQEANHWSFRHPTSAGYCQDGAIGTGAGDLRDRVSETRKGSRCSSPRSPIFCTRFIGPPFAHAGARIKAEPPAVRDPARFCGRQFARERLSEFRHPSCSAIRCVCCRSASAPKVLGELSLPKPARGLFVLLAPGIEVREARLSVDAP